MNKTLDDVLTAIEQETTLLKEAEGMLRGISNMITPDEAAPCPPPADAPAVYQSITKRMDTARRDLVLRQIEIRKLITGIADKLF